MELPQRRESDGLGSVTTQVTNYLDRLAFNAAGNSDWTGQGAGDETAGLGTGYSFSSNVLGADTVEDAFGNRNGAVEPE